MERIISYFLTDIEIEDASEEEKGKYEEFLTNTLDIMTELQNMMRDRMAYGNAFASLLIPFKRFLVCPSKGCATMFPLKTVYNSKIFGFSWDNFQFMATCPKCKKRGVWRVDDKPDDEEKKLRSNAGRHTKLKCCMTTTRTTSATCSVFRRTTSSKFVEATCST